MAVLANVLFQLKKLLRPLWVTRQWESQEFLVEMSELFMANGNCLKNWMKLPNITDRLPWQNGPHRKLQEARKKWKQNSTGFVLWFWLHLEVDFNIIWPTDWITGRREWLQEQEVESWIRMMQEELAPGDHQWLIPQASVTMKWLWPLRRRFYVNIS